MATLPIKSDSQTVSAIYSLWENRQSKPRTYLGGSVIGGECERALWYAFRWAYGGEHFSGRMLRLFDRGQREEERFIADLRGIGCTVFDVDPSSGRQFSFKAIHGHAGGSIDAVASGVPEAPKAYHVCEFKTHNTKSFAALVKEGVQKAKPIHYAQMMIYMRWSQLDRALYLAVNKDTDELYAERIRYDATEAAALEARGERVIFAQEPAPGISADPSFYKCKFCPATTVCHTTTLPRVSCRTCLHATPEREGDGRWSCGKWGCDIPESGQREACPQHLYIPALLHRWGAQVDASADENWVEYRRTDGSAFRNGPRGPHSYESIELSVMTPQELGDKALAAMRDTFDARLIPAVAA